MPDMIDFMFTEVGEKDRERFEPIVLDRCFEGWEKIKHKYKTPGMDGSIVLFIDKQYSKDIHDAKMILDYLQGGDEE